MILRAACRFLLGAVFAAASYGDLILPGSFRNAVQDYQMLPDGAVPWVAAMLMGVQALAATVLLLGAWRPARPHPWADAAARIVAGLLVVYMGAISIDLLRGIRMTCGCFDALGQAIPWFKSSQIGWTTVGRDALFLLLAVPLLRPRSRRS